MAFPFTWIHEFAECSVFGHFSVDDGVGDDGDSDADDSTDDDVDDGDRHDDFA